MSGELSQTNSPSTGSSHCENLCFLMALCGSPSLPLRCCIHHHDNCVPFGCIAVPFCGFLWRRAGTHWTALTTAWVVQAQDRMIPGQTPATFCELTVILQDFYQFFNPFTYLPWSYLLRDLCVDLLCGARSWRDDFHSTGTKKDSRQGMHFKAPGKATALLINSVCVSQPWAGSLTPHCCCPHLHLALGLVVWAGTSQELLQQWRVHCQHLW